MVYVFIKVLYLNVIIKISGFIKNNIIKLQQKALDVFSSMLLKCYPFKMHIFIISNTVTNTNLNPYT